MFVRLAAPLLLPAVVVLCGTVGCSDSVEIPATIPVQGKVMYKDKPLADAEIGFVSKLDNKDVLAARGMTDASGEFTLSTYIDPEHEVSGATPGEYVVTVTKNEHMSPEETMKMFKQNPMMEFKKLVPVKYTEKGTSPLKASVTASGENSFEFKLED